MPKTTNIPYAESAIKIPSLFEKIQVVGQPAKVSAEWLKTIGFASSRDRSFTRLLRELGFTDAGGSPTQQWREYKDTKKAPYVLGQAVKRAYQVLYDVYPDAHNATDTDLRNLISTSTGAGKDMVSQYMSSFRNLAKIARFEATDDSPEPHPNGSTKASSESAVSNVRMPHNSGANLTVNLNVQLTLPETADASFFDAMFTAMRKHLME